MRFEWDARKARSNLRKHGVSFDEAKDAFRDPYAQSWLDSGHADHEDRHQLLAQSRRREILLLISYCFLGDDGVRIISARRASKSERKQYSEE
ncbi:MULTISPECIES: BrnT family toxin [unclassified Duganella]|uniref:BrnT family toxin n=1 Tax=unclassified Duganella TaxID=2636909 RepID=UPI000E340B7D|nr:MULTISPECIES: BrnT family toxin [unclassified Duganella]RFP14629.1 BrnT family toxin [Duganella sp. BJB475]RFP30977.1 BrnT family toxin [Duganella sp. BJB476]